MSGYGRQAKERVDRLKPVAPQRSQDPHRTETGGKAGSASGIAQVVIYSVPSDDSRMVLVRRLKRNDSDPWDFGHVFAGADEDPPREPEPMTCFGTKTGAYFKPYEYVGENLEGWVNVCPAYLIEGVWYVEQGPKWRYFFPGPSVVNLVDCVPVPGLF